MIDKNYLKNPRKPHTYEQKNPQDTAFWERLSRHFDTAWLRWMRFGRFEEGPSPGYGARPKAAPKAPKAAPKGVPAPKVPGGKVVRVRGWGVVLG